MIEPWFEEVFIGFNDCETCGSNNEIIEVDRFDDGLYSVLVSVGCYSGESEYEVSGERAVEVLDNWTHLDPRVQTLIERIKNDLSQ